MSFLAVSFCLYGQRGRRESECMYVAEDEESMYVAEDEESMYVA